jgi:hypothetical protein
MATTGVNAVVILAITLITGKILVAAVSTKCLSAAPNISGMSMYMRSTFARPQPLIISPSIIIGPINGMKTTVPTATIGTRAAAKLTSPRAVPTITGRNGAQGAKLYRSRPITKGSARGRPQAIR